MEASSVECPRCGAKPARRGTCGRCRTPAATAVAASIPAAALRERLEAFIRSFGADKGSLQRYHPKTETLEICDQVGFGPVFLDRFRHVRAGDGSACGEALKRRDCVACGNVFKDESFASLREPFREERLSALVSTPLIHHGSVVGVATAHFRRPRSFKAAELKRYRERTRDLARLLST